MHIFAADEHLRRVLVYTSRRALLIPLRRLPRHSVWAGEREEAVSARKWLPFYPSSKAGFSRPTDEPRLHHFGWRRWF